MSQDVEYKVGDKVVISDFYEVTYSKPWVNSIKNKPATVLSVVHKKVQAADLDKDSKPLWRGLYGNKDVYDLYGMTIRFDHEQTIYLVSNLGFKKADS